MGLFGAARPERFKEGRANGTVKQLPSMLMKRFLRLRRFWVGSSWRSSLSSPSSMLRVAESRSAGAIQIERTAAVSSIPFRREPREV